MDTTQNDAEKVPIVDGSQPQQMYPGAPPHYNVQGYPPVQQQVIIRQAPLTDGPKDYLIEAILVTVCCFWPTGIVAIIKALDVQRASQTGDRQLAEINSVAARKFTCISLWVGIGVFIFTVILLAIYAVFLVNHIKSLDY